MTRYSLGQIDWTLKQIMFRFPELDPYANGGSFSNPNPNYVKLRELFNTLPDQEIADFRFLWHQAYVDNVEGKMEEVKGFLGKLK